MSPPGSRGVLMECGDSDTTVHIPPVRPGAHARGCEDRAVRRNRRPDRWTGTGRNGWRTRWTARGGVPGRIAPADSGAMRAADGAHAQLTKPAGSLGVLEELSVRLAGMAGNCPPPCRRRPWSRSSPPTTACTPRASRPWPQEVTAAMVANFAGRRRRGQRVRPTGRRRRARGRRRRRHPVSTQLDILHAKVRRGHPRPRRRAGADRGRGARPRWRSDSSSPTQLVDDGYRCLLTGDMGIANTTAVGRADRGLHRARPPTTSPAAAPASTTRRWPTRPASCGPLSRCTP